MLYGKSARPVGEDERREGALFMKNGGGVDEPVRDGSTSSCHRSCGGSG